MKKLWKKPIFIKSIFSFVFSFMLVLDSKLICNEEINVFSDVSFASFHVKDFGKEIIFFFITYIFITFFQKIYEHINKKMEKANTKKIPHLFWIAFGVLLLTWLPYFLSYFPGGIYSDTYASIVQLSNFKVNGIGLLSNNNPILYTITLKIFTSLGSSILGSGLTGGILLFEFFQYIGCALALSYVIYVIHKKNLPKRVTFLVLAFFALFPLIPLYVISIWKDTPFNFVLIIYIAFLFDIFTSSRADFKNKKDIIFYCILSLFVCFLRNNGFFVVLGTTLVLLICHYRCKKSINKQFLLSILSLILIVVAIQGPIYSYLHLKGDNFIESVSIPFQQISYSVKKDASLEEKDKEFLNQIIPIEVLKTAAKPLNFDTTKWNNDFNKDFLNSHKIEFFNIWFRLLPKNFNNYIEAYLLQTLGYWDIKKNSSVAYIQTYTWPTHTDLVEQRDLLQELFHFSLRKTIDSFPIISSAFFIWLFFLSITITFLTKKYRYLILYMPGLFIWIPIMIGVPIAFSLRYVYIFVLMIPFDFIIPSLPYKDSKN